MLYRYSTDGRSGHESQEESGRPGRGGSDSHRNGGQEVVDVEKVKRQIRLHYDPQPETFTTSPNSPLR
eukprot:TRINITY_DN8543_c0_g1_i1.p1 TRINITY_DN8543_c0_g1~~TRINITY_DN8543_c0_g1_i1.p1  ORF type:complete len:68 (-),score=4.84 TRINITY_DN8543_c0_g1_i1:145-348(-)